MPSYNDICPTDFISLHLFTKMEKQDNTQMVAVPCTLFGTNISFVNTNNFFHLHLGIVSMSMGHPCAAIPRKFLDTQFTTWKSVSLPCDTNSLLFIMHKIIVANGLAMFSKSSALCRLGPYLSVYTNWAHRHIVSHALKVSWMSLRNIHMTLCTPLAAH